MATYTSFSQDGVVLALWGGEKMLQKMDKTISAKTAKAIVLLSWTEEEIGTWLKATSESVVEI